MSIFMGDHMAYAAAAASAMRNDPYQVASQARYCQAEAEADPVPFELLRNAYRPTVHQRDQWMCEDLGIPPVAEDVQ